MGSQERREREKQELREKILDAARVLFATEGVEATTMRRIAERIEYSPTAIYLHFPDKNALIHEMCVTDFGHLASKFQNLSRERDPFKRLRLAGQAYSDFAEEFPYSFKLMFLNKPVAEDPNPKDFGFGNPDTDAYAFLLAIIQECIEAKRLKPEHKDAELVAQTVWAALHGVVALHLVLEHKDGPTKWRPIQKRIKAMLDLVIDGIERRQVAETSAP